MSNHKLSIVFYINGMKFDGNTLKEHSLGGSETAGLCMARELAKRGHDVTMFCNTDKPDKYDGVIYYNIDNFVPFMGYTKVDVCIIQRIPQMFQTTLKSKVNILWQHDVAVKRARNDFTGSLWNVDEVFALSDFHIKQMSEIYRVPEEIFWKTRNGIDPVTLDPTIERRPKRLIYTARPERGMDILLNDIMPKVWEKDPEVELVLAGYDNTVEQMRPFYDALAAKVVEHQKAGRKVEHLGALTKADLYKEYQKATLYAYPTEFAEISCITAMECMANGLPFISRDVAALKETLNYHKEANVNAGCLLKVHKEQEPEEWKKDFARTLLKLISEPTWVENYSAGGKAFAESHLWSQVAEEWETHFYDLFKERTANKESIARHFYRNEDIMALRHLAWKNDDKAWKDRAGYWIRRVRKDYAIIDEPAVHARLYQDYGKKFLADYKAERIKVEPQLYTRVKLALGILKELKPKSILDYGCAIGNEAIQFVNELDDVLVDCVNITVEEMEVGKDLAKKHCNKPDNIKWIEASSPDDLQEMGYDVVFAGEILEHMGNPTKFIDQLEARCKDGGRMMFTVPFGPWGDTDDVLEQKGHLWSFERSDLKDLFGKKKKFKLRSVAGSVNPKNGETLGWFLLDYVKDGTPTGTVDMERKVALQAPRQSVSACMIIGGQQEGLLHRCLTSIYPVVEEIIILDTGMSKESMDIVLCEKYSDKVKVFKDGPNPLEVGFDEARNESIKHATGDWILWIDSDEELLGAVALLKYLRSNKHNGYAIRQHHFSAQPPNAFRADMPVRLFRNTSDMKFKGMIHEHPEKGDEEGIGFSMVIADVDIAHDGYLTEDVRRERFMRNFGLMCQDREKYPDRKLGKFLMMRDWIHLAKYKMEISRNQITNEIAELCELTIKAYQEDFIKEGLLYNREGLKFYSDALVMMNRGMDFTFSLSVNGHSYLEDEVMMARFDSREDFENFIKLYLKETCEPFEGRYV